MHHTNTTQCIILGYGTSALWVWRDWSIIVFYTCSDIYAYNFIYKVQSYNQLNWLHKEITSAIMKRFKFNVWYVLQYIPRNMHTVFVLLCFVVLIHWLIFPYPSGLFHWHCGNLTIARVPAKQPWWIWINTSCEFIMNDCITTTKQSTTQPCAYFLGYTVCCT